MSPRIKSRAGLAGAFFTLSILGLLSTSNNAFAETKLIETGDISAHPSFADGAFYESVVDSYYQEQYINEHGTSEGYVQDASHWSEILTDEQLASIKNYGCSSHVQASRAAHLTSLDGIELLTGVENFFIDTCYLDVDELPLSSMPNLKHILLYGGTPTATIDFSNNPLLENITIVGYDFSSLDLSSNTSLKYINIYGVNGPSYSSPELTLTLPRRATLEQLSLVDTKLVDNTLDLTNFSGSIGKLLITGVNLAGAGYGDDDIISAASLDIQPDISTRLSKSAGRGDGDSDGENSEEMLELNLSNLSFLQESHTNLEGEISNETLTSADPTCYTYDSTSNTVLVKTSCVENGLESVILTHSYTLTTSTGSTDYTHNFTLGLNPVSVFGQYYLDGVLQNESDGAVDLGRKFLHQEYSSDDYAKPELGELKSVELVAFGPNGEELSLTSFATSTDNSLKGIIDSDSVISLHFLYYYETPTASETADSDSSEDSADPVKTPNTGTGEKTAYSSSASATSLIFLTIPAVFALVFLFRVTLKEN